METKEIANGLVALCREGKFDEAMVTYYAEDIVSVEYDGETANGLAACQAKGEAWGTANEIHSVTVSEPFIGQNQFAVQFGLDITDRATGQRMMAQEIAVYTVESGKITHETFLFAGM